MLQKFHGFNWPSWVADVKRNSHEHISPYANPVLLNTSGRNWQIITNYLSEDELKIDQTGMISGPGSSRWSIEFWVFSKNSVIRPADNMQDIFAKRIVNTGEVIVDGSFKGFSFQQRITGGKSNVNEAVVSYRISSKNDMADSLLLMVVRPYNLTTLGGIDKIEYVKTGNSVRINGMTHVVAIEAPDNIFIGSGLQGDVAPDAIEKITGGAIECNYSMATLALAYNLSGASSEYTFRISMDSQKELPTSISKRYEDCVRDFTVLYEMRISEGVYFDIPFEKYMDIINQSRISMLNINTGDVLPLTAGKARDTYFYIYGLIRAGQVREAENIISTMIDRLAFNEKKKDFDISIIAAYIVASFNEIYLHKRDAEYLQKNFGVLREVGDYIYSFTSEIHGLSFLHSNTVKYDWISESREHDFFTFYLAMRSMEYLSRCMGIFGHESRFKNEADRIQFLVRDIYDKKKNALLLNCDDFKGLIVFPERLYMSTTQEEYNKLFSNLFISDSFPVIDRIYGLDMFSCFTVLNQMLLMKDARFYEFFDNMLLYIDDFFSLPEYIDTVSGGGSWGDGNSKVIASLLFVIMRNMIFVDSSDRLELFPVPDERFFQNGKRIKIENAPSRFGLLSFIIESAEKEIKIVFTELPKYIPSDIQINLPFSTKIIEGDDFILKKKINNSYLINGWPSSVRFQIV